MGDLEQKKVSLDLVIHMPQDKAEARLTILNVVSLAIAIVLNLIAAYILMGQ
jgi:hypothetical protein